ncbi:Vacuolar protein sorting-associated protein 8 [Apophysomyces ossiformis]|uniref:Vacuolar protein sorting-associated protein 8 n=1 Tax=Apophysomyces ossiformis TaxID=679940 RepID=A0A8H7BTU4_9FUNG|nr:Vacuolar protein sorting-associated protein 8 [Apophysomyces ossiformis]
MDSLKPNESSDQTSDNSVVHDFIRSDNISRTNNTDDSASILMEHSSSTSTIKFRNNYDALLKEVLEENSDEDDDEEDRLLNQIDIDLDAATAELPDELRAALEDRSLADKYLANLKTFMSHRRTHSMSSMTSGKGEFSSPSTPLQPSFAQSLSPKNYFRVQQDPLSKVLDAIPYQTRLVNGVQSLTVLEQKFHTLQIPELDLPIISETVIRSRLDDLYKIQDDLYIHLHGGPLVKNTLAHNIGEKKRTKVMNLLDKISKEIGLYEEFVKRANYLSLENILNESDSSSIDEGQDSETFETESGSLLHFDSSSDMSRMSAGTPASPAAHLSISPISSTHTVSPSPKSPRRTPDISGQDSRPSSATAVMQRYSPGGSSASRHSSDFGNMSDKSSDLSVLLGDNNASRPESKDGPEPWEAFKWTRLEKISDQLYSEEIKRSSGLVSVLAVSGIIAVGTMRGLIFVYDYSQNLKCILGDTTRAVEVGSVTSLAISADHTTVACGHSQGYIVVWDVRKPSQPFRTIDPMPMNQVTSTDASLATQQQQLSRKEGHVKGAAILHIGFVGVKKSEIVSGDDQGMAFYHVLYKVVMINAVDTTRILGRYQNLSFPSELSDSPNGSIYGRNITAEDMPRGPKPKRPSTVFAMQPLPLGQIPHPAENFGLVALLTPYKMIIVGLKPTPQTQYKYLKPKPSSHNASAIESSGLDATHSQNGGQLNTKVNVESLSGCLAWLPVTKSTLSNTKDAVKDKKTKEIMPSTDPMLAFSWGNHLFILRVGIESTENGRQNGRLHRTSVGSKNKRGTRLEFVKQGEWKCRDPIVGLHWINRQILVLFTPNEEMILFDPKKMVETERASIRNKQLIYHDWFNAPLKELVKDSVTLTQQLPGLKHIFVGTLLSWADRIIALVKTGDFLEAIELATLFYNGKCIQTVIGLPEDEAVRKQVVGGQLMELLNASLNYTFSSKRTYVGMGDSDSVLFRDLAAGCIEACLSMNDLEFLFETVYERFAESGVRGIFLEVLEPYIVKQHLSDLPPSVMKDLVEHYGQKKMLRELEQVIWHVNPQCLGIDQIVSMCHKEGMYEAMMYVWNRSMEDYVSPVVEMLKVIREVLKAENAQANEDEGYGTQMMRCSSAETEGARSAAENSDRKRAEKLFDYLTLILRGRTFPDGDPMPKSRANEARSAVYSFVFSGRCVIWPRVGGKLVLTADDETEMLEPTYPYLRLLLRFNTKRFLETLVIAFEDPWLNGGDDILTSKAEPEEMPGKVISRQIIINTLLDVMGGGLAGRELPPPRPKQSVSTSTVHSSGTPVHGSTRGSDTASSYDRASNDGLIQFCTFIALNLHKYTTFILLPPKTLHKILVRLADDHNKETRKQRQRAVQSLLTVYNPPNEEQMILLYEDAGFWRVLEDVYRRDRKYGKLVEAYLKDEDRKEMVFSCVNELLSEQSSLTQKQRNEVKQVFMIRISQFVEIDGQKTAEIVEAFFERKHAEAIRRLEEDQEFDDDEYHTTVDKRVFSYLRGLLEPNESDNVHFDKIPVDRLIDDAGMVVQRPASQVSAAIQERYIELMCRFDPSGVYNFFNTKLDGDVNLENIIKCCEKYGVMDAVVWIMEKSGNTKGALEKMLEVGKEKMTTLLSTIRDREQSEEWMWTFEKQNIISTCLIGLKGVLRVGIQSCEKHSRMAVSTYMTELDSEKEEKQEGEDGEQEKKNENRQEAREDIYKEEEGTSEIASEESETLWFRLLDAYVEWSIEVYNALGSLEETEAMPSGLHQHVVSSFKSYVQSILTSLLLSTSPEVSLPRLLMRLIHSQSRGETTFADFRDIFLSMLDTYKYEGKLLEMTNRLFERDLFCGVQEMVRKKGRGWRPRRPVCEICRATVLDLELMNPKLTWGLEPEDEKQKAKKKNKQGREREDEEDNEAEGEGEDDETEDEPEAENKEVIIFHCGHVYHRQCMDLQCVSTQVCTVCHHGVSKAKDQNKGKGKAQL